MVSIVGTRHPTSYGIEVTRLIAGTAARAGVVVVSGMARGLDAVAHRTAVEYEGRTIGVLGNGLGVVYPAAHRELYQQVADRGLLLTEYPPGERPHAGSFPMRNRLIAALGRATVVVEAAERSGALNTASQALCQGKDVLAVPGPITSRTSAGTNRLIRDGAAPFLDEGDLLTLYPDVVPPAPLAAAAGTALGADQRRVLEKLDGVPRSIDGLAAELGLPAALVLQAVSEFQIVGIAEREAEGFRLAR